MEREFVPYELAVKLKELGFDEPCVIIYYNDGKNYVISETLMTNNELSTHDEITSPLYQQTFRWFREKYSDLDFGVSKIHNGTNNYHYHINLTWEFFEGTYEEAELACLQKLIEIVEQKIK